MRLGGALLLVVVIAVAVLLLLGRADIERTSGALDTMADRLREEGVEGRPFDRREAYAAIEVLGDLADRPGAIPASGDELDTIIARAASWAEAAPAPSDALRVAVALRTAAVELRGWPGDPSSARLDRARAHLEDASATLDGTAAPQTLTDGVRDRLRNLEQVQRDRYQQLDDGLE